MKALKLLCIGVLLLVSGANQAQVIVSAVPPMWGPVGYPEVRYYYLPGVEAYYDVHNSMFIYYNDKAWIRKPNLPSRYKHFDLYSAYKVVLVDYRGDTPYQYHKQHKKSYSMTYSGVAQKTIGNRPGNGNKNPANQKSQDKPGKGNQKNKVRQSKQ